MSWIAENWLALLIGGGILAMHLFGRGRGANNKAQGRAYSPSETANAMFGPAAASRSDLSRKPKFELASAVEQVEFTSAAPKT